MYAYTKKLHKSSLCQCGFICERPTSVWFYLWASYFSLVLFVSAPCQSGFICERPPSMWFYLWAPSVSVVLFVSVRRWPVFSSWQHRLAAVDDRCQKYKWHWSVQAAVSPKRQPNCNGVTRSTTLDIGLSTNQTQILITSLRNVSNLSWTHGFWKMMTVQVRKLI